MTSMTTSDSFSVSDMIIGWFLLLSLIICLFLYSLCKSANCCNSNVIDNINIDTRSCASLPPKYSVVCAQDIENSKDKLPTYEEAKCCRNSHV